MCGDVNLFFNVNNSRSECEIEIMVAEASSRRGGIGSEAVALMMEQGYVIRHADLTLGRAEASLARWPEYRIQLQVSDAQGGSLVSVSALRGSQPIPPYVLDPWLVELQRKLGELP